MTEVELQDYTRRCAAFLGMYDYSLENEYFDKGRYYKFPDGESDTGYQNPGSGYFDCLNCFYEDWNWIMEVVEAIQRVTTMHIYNSYCTIATEVNVSYIKAYGSNKESVVSAIDQYLNWYKDNNK